MVLNGGGTILRYFIPEYVNTSVDDGEYIIFNLENGYLYGLDSVGSEIWRMVEEGNKLIEIIHCLQRKYQISNELATEDVSKLIAKLEENGLVIRR